MEVGRPKQVAIFRQRLKDAGSFFRFGATPDHVYRRSPTENVVIWQSISQRLFESQTSDAQVAARLILLARKASTFLRISVNPVVLLRIVVSFGSCAPSIW